VERALSHYDDWFTREVTLYTSWLAEAHLQAGDVEHAAKLALRTAEMTARTSSARSDDRVRTLAAELAPHSDVSAARELVERCVISARSVAPQLLPVDPNAVGSKASIPRGPDPTGRIITNISASSTARRVLTDAAHCDAPVAAATEWSQILRPAPTHGPGCRGGLATRRRSPAPRTRPRRLVSNTVLGRKRQLRRVKVAGQRTAR